MIVEQITMQIFFIDWWLVLPRRKYECYFIYTSVASDNIIGANNADISPALLHINLECNSNFTYSNNRISNTDIVRLL